MHFEDSAHQDPDGRDIPEGLVVRLGSQRDIDACVALAVQVGAGVSSAWHRTLERTAHDGVERALFVAEVDGVVIGFARAVYASSPEHDERRAPEGWYLLGIAVDTAWRRRGVGDALTRARMRWLRSRRVERVYYFTHRNNEASRALHDRFGFVEVPGHWIPPGGTFEDAAEQQLYVAHTS